MSCNILKTGKNFSLTRRSQDKNILEYQDLLRPDREDLGGLRSGKQEANSLKSRESEQEELAHRKLEVLVSFR